MKVTHRMIVDGARISRPLSLGRIISDARSMERSLGYPRSTSVSHAIDREIHRATR